MSAFYTSSRIPEIINVCVHSKEVDCSMFNVFNVLLGCLKYRTLRICYISWKNLSFPTVENLDWLILNQHPFKWLQFQFTVFVFTWLPKWEWRSKTHLPNPKSSEIKSTQGQYIFSVRWKRLVILRHRYQNLRYILNWSWLFYIEVQLFLQITDVLFRVFKFKANCS